MLTQEKLTLLLQLVNQSPSADNCQPFSFTLQSNTLLIDYDPAIAEHPLNKDQVASYLTIGFLIKYIKLSCQILDLSPEITTNLDNLEEKKKIIITCQLSESKNSPISSYSIEDLLNRQTNRNQFKRNNEKQRTHIGNYFSSKEGLPNSKHYYAKKASLKFINFVALNENLIFAWEAVFSKVLGWVRFTEKEVFETKDGLDYRNLGISFLEARFLGLLKSTPLLKTVFLKLKLYSTSYPKQFFNLLKSREFLLITSKSKSPISLIETGESVCESWIHLNKIGVSTQPMNPSALMFWNYFALGDRESLSKEALKRTKVFKQMYREEFKLKDDEIPVFLFRIGSGPMLETKLQSLRKTSNYTEHSSQFTFQLKTPLGKLRTDQ